MVAFFLLTQLKLSHDAVKFSKNLKCFKTTKHLTDTNDVILSHYQLAAAAWHGLSFRTVWGFCLWHTVSNVRHYYEFVSVSAGISAKYSLSWTGRCFEILECSTYETHKSRQRFYCQLLSACHTVTFGLKQPSLIKTCLARRLAWNIVLLIDAT